jgi:outer membrane protein TolC
VEAGERLNVAMGVWGERTAWRLAEELPEAPKSVPGVPENFERRAVASSLRVEAARVRLQAAARRAGAAGAAVLLDDAQAGVVAERNEERAWEVGPSFSVPLPIFDTGAAGRASAEAAMRRERELYADEAIRVRAAARVAAARLEGAGAEERHRREVLVPLAERELAETLLRYNAMQAGAPELLEARGRVAMARAAHAGALGRLWVAALRVEELGAGGSPEESGGTGTGAVSGGRTGGADAAGGH